MDTRSSRQPIPIEVVVSLRIEHCEGVDVEDSPCWDFYLRILGIGVRIGRKDTTARPPIFPEMDLTRVLDNLSQDKRSVVSRVHAVIERDAQGVVTIRAAKDRRATWIRHTGSSEVFAVATRPSAVLQDRDILYLGDPSGRHVRLRVRIG